MRWGRSARPCSRASARWPRPPPTSTSPRRADRRRALLGHRGARARAAGRLPGPAVRALQRSRAGGQLGGRHHRPGSAPTRATTSLARGLAERGGAVSPGRSDRRAHALRRAVPVAPIPRTRDCCCTPSITAPTAGTTCPRDARCRAASPRCGATTTPASWPCSCCARPRAFPTRASSSAESENPSDSVRGVLSGSERPGLGSRRDDDAPRRRGAVRSREGAGYPAPARARPRRHRDSRPSRRSLRCRRGCGPRTRDATWARWPQGRSYRGSRRCCPGPSRRRGE